jgi:hypothetical protein
MYTPRHIHHSSSVYEFSACAARDLACSPTDTAVYQQFYTNYLTVIDVTELLNYIYLIHHNVCVWLPSSIRVAISTGKEVVLCDTMVNLFAI